MSRPRTLVACAAAAVVVLRSPLIGDLRNALLRTVPRYYVLIVSLGVVLGGAVVLGACARAIRDDRPRRFALLALAVLLAVVSFALLRSGNANVDAVEAWVRSLWPVTIEAEWQIPGGMRARFQRWAELCREDRSGLDQLLRLLAA